MNFEIVEVLNIIGLNGHRFLNKPLEEIELKKNEYKSGLLRYERMANVDDELYLNNFRMMLRVVVKTYHEEILQLTGIANEKKQICCHLLVFENWMPEPSQELKYYAKSEEEYLKLSTLNFWRLVDVDGFFNGNSYYRECSDNLIIK